MSRSMQTLVDVRRYGGRKGRKGLPFDRVVQRCEDRVDLALQALGASLCHREREAEEGAGMCCRRARNYSALPPTRVSLFTLTDTHFCCVVGATSITQRHTHTVLSAHLPSMAPSKKAESTWATSAAIGAMAGAASKTAVAPIERIRLLLQMQTQAHSSSSFNAVIGKEGLSGLWRGNGLAVVRAMAQKGLLFSTQDHVRVSLGSDMTAGAIAGLTASGLTYPLDLLRTRHAG